MIHHYTSIAALAAILRHRTIRFGRLDTLDDTQEAQHVRDIDFGKMLFASCWVEKDEEDIAQWAMYGDAMKGVRISLPRQPFADVTRISDASSVARSRYQGYTLIPDVIDHPDEFLSNVVYVNDVAECYATRIEFFDLDGVRINGRATALATFKNRYWEFQKEVRFILHAVPGPTGWATDQEWAVKFAEMTRAGKWGMIGPDVLYIDRPISEEALSSAEVVLGPLANDSDRLIAESLIASWAPGLPLRKSELTGLIRHR